MFIKAISQQLNDICPNPCYNNFQRYMCKENGRSKKMYSKFVAILINSAFGLCITYTVFSVYFALTSKFIVERSFILGFSLYNIVWMVLDIVYNEARYHRQGGGLFFWTSIMLPPILIMLILMLVIVMFF